MKDPRADSLRAGYAPVARGYTEQLSGELDGKPLDRAFLRAFAERVAQGLIVDAGCGPGHVGAFVAAAAGFDVQVEGIDLSPDMVDAAAARHPHLAFREGDLFALPYADASVAGIVAFYAIVHLQTAELAGVFSEFARVLAPGGLAAIAFHAGDQTVHVDELFGAATSLDFVFHLPKRVVTSLVEVGFVLEARLDRQPYPDEHPSERTYLLVRR